MRKSLIIVVSMLFMLGFYASAFAADVTIGGEIRVRGEFDTNTTDFDNDVGDNTSWYDQRVRLSVDAQVTPNTKGFIELQTVGINPYNQGVDSYPWGSGESGATGYPEGNSEGEDLHIRQAYILHQGSGLLGYNAGIKIGRMPLKLGNSLFFDHTKFGDDAIVLFADPTNELMIGLVNIKLTEGLFDENDDSDVYIGLFAYKGSGYNVSGDVTYVNDQDFSSDGLGLWNFGLRGDTSVAGFTLRGDLEVQTGEAEGTSALGTDVDFKGWAALVGVDYALENVTVGAEFAYGSGDDDPADNDFESFVNTLGADEQHYTYVYEDRVTSAAGALSTGLTNTWYIKVGADTKVNPDLSVGADLYYLEASETTGSIAEEIGVEIDANLNYKIDKNLVYFVEAGYLFADDFYGTDLDNPYVVRHGLTLTF